MAVDVDRLKGHGRVFVDGFTPAQKAITALCVVAVVIAGVAFMKWTSTPDDAPLYTHLSAADATAVTAALDARHVPYEVSAGGQTILIRRGDVAKTRLALGAENIPAGAGSSAQGSVATNGTSTQLAQAQAYDAALEQRIENMVASTLGPGHAAVTVAAELDGSKRSSVATKYGTTVPITQNDDHETIAPNAGGTSATPTTVYEKTQTQQHNVADSTVTNSTSPPGALERLSVSVLLDRAVVTPAEVASIWRPSIAAAAGIDPKRDGNNALKVMTVAFSKSAQKQEAQLSGTTTSNRLIDLAKQLLILVMLALVLFVAWHAMKRAERNRSAPPSPLDLRELETVRPAGAAIDPASATSRIGSVPFRAPLDTSPASIELEIAELIERQPDEVAQTLRSWLADRRT
jgi:flagellar M-ring protein FliF